MLPITSHIISHFAHHGPKVSLLLDGKQIYFPPNDQKAKEVSVAMVRSSHGVRVKSYSELIRYVAELGYFNQQFNLFFRGQTNDYKNSKKMSVVYPSICRPESGARIIQTLRVVKRYKKLLLFAERIRNHRREGAYPHKLFRYPEFYYSLIQHYELHSTTLIDLTQSLRVAATFALNEAPTGYVLVFGMPHLQGSISHYIDLNMVMVKLQSVCPPNALRPHYQEGFLVGKYPIVPRKEAGDNLARRLIGKYLLDNSDGDFWSRSFAPIPNNALMPKDDPYGDELRRMIASDSEEI